MSCMHGTPGHAPDPSVPSRHVEKCPDPTRGSVHFFQEELHLSVNLRVCVSSVSPSPWGGRPPQKRVLKTELITSSHEGFLVEAGFEEGGKLQIYRTPQSSNISYI